MASSHATAWLDNSLHSFPPLSPTLNLNTTLSHSSLQNLSHCTLGTTQDNIARPILLVPRLATIGLLLVSLFIYYLYQRPSFPHGSPREAQSNLPIVGSPSFLKRRWGFIHEHASKSPTGTFSFHLGKHRVIGLTGDKARRDFFDNKYFGFLEGYATMLAGQAPTGEYGMEKEDQDNSKTTGFVAYFNQRVIKMIHPDNLGRGVPHLIADVKAKYAELAETPNLVVNPYETIYKLVFKLTMRTVGACDIADDPKLLDKTFNLYEEIDNSTSPIGIIFPWLPVVNIVRQYVAGGQLYLLFNSIVSRRKASGKKMHDGLQFLVDHGDSVRQIVEFIIGAVFAGLFNSGINGAWVLCYLAHNPQWASKAREEVETVANRYCPEGKEHLSLIERLDMVPARAWINEFEFLDICLKESVRLQLVGTLFRRNLTGKDHLVAGDVVPHGAFVAYHPNDIHRDPSLYPEPNTWNPGRWLAGSEAVPKSDRPHKYVGFGSGRHPCTGRKFSQLENAILTAYFLAFFPHFDLCEADGTKTKRMPVNDLNAQSVGRPKDAVYLKLTPTMERSS